MPSNNINTVRENLVKFLPETNLGKRVVTAMVLLGSMAFCFIKGGVWFLTFCGGIALLTGVEWVTLAIRHLQGSFLKRLLLTLIGMGYIGGGFAGWWFWYQHGAFSHPGGLFSLFSIIWATDIAAYFVGRALQGPKLAPRISPSKTWSGAVGGILAACLTIPFQPSHPISPWILVPVLSMVGQGGDLWESWVKRRLGVKDSGSFLPGHGGFLDRLDSALAVGWVLLWLSYRLAGK
jgi:phosphatidate cytidylyltransferase